MEEKPELDESVGKKPRRASKKEKKTAPVKLKLLITVVNRSKAEFYMDTLQSYSVNLQLGMSAKGTANTETLRYLGLGESEKTVILSVIKQQKEKEILDMLAEKFDTIRNGKGIAYTIPFTSTIGVLIYQFLSDNRSVIRDDRQQQ